MHKSEDKTLLFALLPSSIKEEPVFKHSAQALYAGDDSKDHLKDGLFYYRFDELSSDTLDHLAAQWHAHVWRDSWDIETKRQVLRTLIQTKSHLGTKGAIVDVCQSLVGGAASIIEWFETEPQGTPHTFIVKVNQELTGRRVPSEVLADLINGINYAKPVRSQYTLVLVNQPLYSELDLSSVVRMMTYTHFYTNPTLWYEMNSDSCFSGGSRSMTYSHFYS
ncbi:MAG: phage tail protein I [Succinivibrio sp.]|nr:phage tail protein I [Succinivibrio sp.]